jgi:shikimate dehydrogenase
MNLYGLIGYPLSHSFSKQYFTAKFEREGILDARYELFPIPTIEDLPKLLREHQSTLRGLNVTIPYKQQVIPYLDTLDPTAAAANAVNCIRIESDGRLCGYNTDVIGFKDSLRNTGDGRWAATGQRALILGTGGAAQAVAFVLRTLGIDYQFVTRTRSADLNVEMYLTYAELTDRTLVPDIDSSGLMAPTLIVNTTPLGMSPNIDSCPDLPMERLGAPHLIFDLVYNPATTLLLQRAAARGCTTQNGLPMLIGQAEAAWGIWNKA